VHDVRIVECAGKDPLGVVVKSIQRRAFDAGVARGLAEARDREAGLLAAAVERLEEERVESSEALSRTAVEIALEVARQLLRSEIVGGRHDIEKMVRDTLETSAAGRGRCVVHLNPEDLAALEGVEFRSGTTLQADIGVPRGDVHVETALGLMVKEVDGALESIGERLREKLR